MDQRNPKEDAERVLFTAEIAENAEMGEEGEKGRQGERVTR